MTLEELRTYVRAVVELDDTDLPDAVLNVWLRDAFNRVLSMEGRWPFLEFEAGLTATPLQRQYNLSAIGGGVFREIVEVIDIGAFGNGMRLQYVEHEHARGMYVGVHDVPGQPYWYSKSGAAIHLWPMPQDAHQYLVAGYRKPVDWIAAGAATPPDCDDRLHLPLADWALARYFQSQEDTEMSQLYERAFKDGARLARDDIMRVHQDRPLILNRGWPNPSMQAWLQSIGRRQPW